jgi:hypothetical protein
LAPDSQAWIDEVALDEASAGHVYQVAIARNASGQALVAWQDYQSPSAGHSNRTWVYDGMGSWYSTTRLLMPEPDDEVYGATVALNAFGEGFIGTHTVDLDGPSQFIRSIQIGGAISEPEYIAHPSDYESTPEVTIDRMGRGLCNVQSEVQSVTQVSARSYAPGQGWGAAEALGGAYEDDPLPPHLVMSAAGNAFAYWARLDPDDDNQVLMLVSYYAADHGWFEPQIYVRSIGSFFGGPKMVMDGDSNGTLVYTRAESGYQKLFAMRLASGTE